MVYALEQGQQVVRIGPVLVIALNDISLATATCKIRNNTAFWSASMPTCQGNHSHIGTEHVLTNRSVLEVLCADLSANLLVHGHIAVGGRKVDSTAEYKCSVGYQLVGDAKRKCQQIGSWTGNHPICQGITVRNDCCNMNM